MSTEEQVWVKIYVLVFNLCFEIVIYYLIFCNNCNNDFPLVLSSWSCSERGAAIYCIVYTRHNQLKRD